MSNTDTIKLIQKIFTDIIKDMNRSGPSNIYVKLSKDELVVNMEGIITNYEKYLINTFGQEAIDTFTSFYERDCSNTEKRLKDELPFEIEYSFYKLESDFLKDKFAYRMKKTIKKHEKV